MKSLSRTIIMQEYNRLRESGEQGSLFRLARIIATRLGYTLDPNWKGNNRFVVQVLSEEVSNSTPSN